MVYLWRLDDLDPSPREYDKVPTGISSGKPMTNLLWIRYYRWFSITISYYYHNINYEKKPLLIITNHYSKEVPTIWTDGKAEAGGEKRREEKRREEKRRDETRRDETRRDEKRREEKREREVYEMK